LKAIEERLLVQRNKRKVPYKPRNKYATDQQHIEARKKNKPQDWERYNCWYLTDMKDVELIPKIFIGGVRMIQPSLKKVRYEYYRDTPIKSEDRM